MGYFDELIRARKLSDDELYREAFAHMADAVSGQKLYASLNSHQESLLRAAGQVLGYYQLRMKEIPEDLTDTNGQLDYLCRPYGVMRRQVRLSGKWYRDGYGPMIATWKESGRPVALIPRSTTGFRYYDEETGKFRVVNKKTAELFQEEALVFYRPLPQGKLSVKDLFVFMAKSRSLFDMGSIIVRMMLITLVGMMVPNLTQVLYGKVLQSGKMSLLVMIGLYMICIRFGQALLSVGQSLLGQRVSAKQDMAVEAAFMMRMLSLPAPFFRQYSSGDLSMRLRSVTSLCQSLFDLVMGSGLTSLFSLVYIFQVIKFAPSLVVPSLLTTLASILFSLYITMKQTKGSEQKMNLAAKESGMNFAIIKGMQKIKLTGSQKRAFARWGQLYAKEAELAYNPPMLIKINSVISYGISVTGTIVMYYIAISQNISQERYMAFMASFAMVSAALTQLSGIAVRMASVKPSIDFVRPILETEPESREYQEALSNVRGNLEFSNICFRYEDNGPNVLNHLNLNIRQGEYVAVVGETGCGKSTLIRVLLGFEKPQTGAVFVDGKDLSDLDLPSWRRKTGVVMQNGSLMMGSIYDNIVLSAPTLGMEEAWEAAQIAGIADDIREMPMGMQTIISEGGGQISGGQKQRLLIARAIAPKPKVLIFDEATSALDNVTQKQVSDSLDSLKCTRIVIAHRLSTIRNCDRILVMQGGKIVQEGTYDELVNAGGFFAELVDRQRLDK